MDKVSRERCGSPVLGQVGMSQPSFLLATRKGLLEGAPAQILRVKVRMRIDLNCLLSSAFQKSVLALV